MGSSPVARRVERAWRTGTRIVRAVLLVGAVGVALLGALLGPPSAVLLWAPVVGLVTLGATALALRVFAEAPGRRRTVLVSGVVGVLLAPFTSGLGVLGSAGGVLLVAMLVLGALWVAELAADAVDAGPAAGVRRQLVTLRRVLPDIPLDALLAQWRQVAPQLRQDTEPEVRGAAAELRSLLLDELSRRDPAGVERWLRSGVDEPAPYLHPGGAGRAV